MRLNTRFQSTLLQEERQVFVPLLLIFQYFNPRSYKRSDVYLPHDRRRNNYFNPRSYKRSDVVYTRRFKVDLNFNPRSYKRSDMYQIIAFFIFFHFNPRSYKRSDKLRVAIDCCHLDFNPRSYKRSDLNALLKNPYVRLFQSTLLQEERRYSVYTFWLNQ